MAKHNIDWREFGLVVAAIILFATIIFKSNLPTGYRNRKHIEALEKR